MSDNRSKKGYKITGSTRVMYIIPSAAKEFNKLAKGDASFRKGFWILVVSWVDSKETLPHPQKGDMYEKIGDLYRIKKRGTQVRLLGYSEGYNFFVMKCIKKKKDKIDIQDIETANQRKESFDINQIEWKEELWRNI